MEKMITITDGSMTLTAPLSYIVEVNRAPDSLIFKFKGGSFLHSMDVFMPEETRQYIEQAIHTVSGANLEINLKNYKQPVRIVIK